MTEMLRRIATVLANARGARNGVPPVTNVLELLQRTMPVGYEELMGDVRAILEELREPTAEMVVAGYEASLKGDVLKAWHAMVDAIGEEPA